MEYTYEKTQRPVENDNRIMTIMMIRGHASAAKWGLSHIAPNLADCALDVGCGDGANLVRLLALCPDGLVTGVDHSNVCVEKSKKAAGAAIYCGQCRVLQADVSDLPFEDNSFNLVTGFETVYFWHGIEHAFRQVNRVLKPGGHFLICNETDGMNTQKGRWSADHLGIAVYNAGQLKHFLINAGFTDIHTERETKKHWLCVTAKKPETEEQYECNEL